MSGWNASNRNVGSSEQREPEWVSKRRENRNVGHIPPIEQRGERFVRQHVEQGVLGERDHEVFKGDSIGFPGRIGAGSENTV